MSSADEHHAPEVAPRRSARLRKIGVTVLVLGLAAAGLVYWLGTRSANVADDPSMADFRRAQKHQMAVLYGKSGQMTDDLIDALKRPGTQATLIAAFATMCALACFYLGRPLPHDAGSARRDVPPREP